MNGLWLCMLHSQGGSVGSQPSRIIHPGCDDDVGHVSTCLTPVGMISRFPTISFSASRADIAVVLPSASPPPSSPPPGNVTCSFSEIAFIFFNRDNVAPVTRVTCCLPLELRVILRGLIRGKRCCGFWGITSRDTRRSERCNVVDQRGIRKKF